MSARPSGPLAGYFAVPALRMPEFQRTSRPTFPTRRRSIYAPSVLPIGVDDGLRFALQRSAAERAVRIAIELFKAGTTPSAVFDWLLQPIEGSNDIALQMLHGDATAPIPLARCLIASAAPQSGDRSGDVRWTSAYEFLCGFAEVRPRGHDRAWPLPAARRPVDALVAAYHGDECEALGVFAGAPISSLGGRTFLETCVDGEWCTALDAISRGNHPAYPYPAPEAGEGSS